MISIGTSRTLRNLNAVRAPSYANVNANRDAHVSGGGRGCYGA